MKLFPFIKNHPPQGGERERGRGRDKEIKRQRQRERRKERERKIEHRLKFCNKGLRTMGLHKREIFMLIYKEVILTDEILLKFSV